jgi:hypothetical protein
MPHMFQHVNVHAFWAAEDSSEHHDLSGSRPDLLAKLLQRFAAHTVPSLISNDSPFVIDCECDNIANNSPFHQYKLTKRAERAAD